MSSTTLQVQNPAVRSITRCKAAATEESATHITMVDRSELAQGTLTRARQQLVERWLEKQEQRRLRALFAQEDVDKTPPHMYRPTKEDEKRWKWLVSCRRHAKRNLKSESTEKCHDAPPKRSKQCAPQAHTGQLNRVSASPSANVPQLVLSTTESQSGPISLPMWAQEPGPEPTIADLPRRTQSASPLGERPLPAPHALVAFNHNLDRVKTPGPSYHFKAVMHTWTNAQPTLHKLSSKNLVQVLCAKGGVREAYDVHPFVQEQVSARIKRTEEPAIVGA